MTRAPFELYGIFGCPLKHTLSPSMQEAAFQSARVSAYYLPLESGRKDFLALMRQARRLTLNGFNVTVPYKQDVIRFMDQIEPEAKAVGAVNTAYRKSGRWVGTNTDVYGFASSLICDGRFNVADKAALVLGAGGAARAVVYALAKGKASAIHVANRHHEKAAVLVRKFSKLFPRTEFSSSGLKRTEVQLKLCSANLVVNATSLGLKKSDKPVFNFAMISRARGRERKLFVDLIYNPPLTPFLKAARRRGHRILGGLGMLLYQGAKAFEYWTGKPAPIGVMRNALAQGLKLKGSAGS